MAVIKIEDYYLKERNVAIIGRATQEGHYAVDLFGTDTLFRFSIRAENHERHSSEGQRILECLQFRLIDHGWSPADIRLRRTGRLFHAVLPRSVHPCFPWYKPRHRSVCRYEHPPSDPGRIPRSWAAGLFRNPGCRPV